MFVFAVEALKSKSVRINDHFFNKMTHAPKRVHDEVFAPARAVGPTMAGPKVADDSQHVTALNSCVSLRRGIAQRPSLPMEPGETLATLCSHPSLSFPGRRTITEYVFGGIGQARDRTEIVSAMVTPATTG